MKNAQMAPAGRASAKNDRASGNLLPKESPDLITYIPFCVTLCGLYFGRFGICCSGRLSIGRHVGVERCPKQ